MLMFVSSHFDQFILLLPMENVEEQSMVHNVKINSVVSALSSATDLEEEEALFFHEFQCCICLDLLYKPVVIACGHLSCFWCVFKAMDASSESYCPICRHPYNHFPSVCQLLHFLLLKMYPIAYSRRARQVGEEETKVGNSSPQLDYKLSRPDEIYLHMPIYLKGKLSSEGSLSVENNSSIIKDSQEKSINGERKTEELTLATSRISDNTFNEFNKFSGWNEKKLELGTSTQPSVFDLLCAGCNELLIRPVALNCGHVYCEACFIVPQEGHPRCQICQSFHPNRFSSVCLVLEHFIKQCFSNAYAKRRDKLLKQDHSNTWEKVQMQRLCGENRLRPL
ncbi:E3 ubiquitin-protein ligase PRT1 [Linum grandiflorum]